MSSWRMAKSLDKLLAQINTKYPKRSKASDGGIGNAEHSARTSDHNPDTDGVVKARDFTHDPAGGLNSELVAQALLDSRDPRIKYVISNRKIAAGSDGPSPWKWRKYTGANAHDHHFHISVKKGKSFFDDTADWNLNAAPTAAEVKASPVAAAYVPPPPTLLPGSKDKATVKKMQTLLNAKGAKITVDGIFKKASPPGETETALRAFQTKNKLAVDGKCGPASWGILTAL